MSVLFAEPTRSALLTLCPAAGLPPGRTASGRGTLGRPGGAGAAGGLPRGRAGPGAAAAAPCGRGYGVASKLGMQFGLRAFAGRQQADGGKVRLSTGRMKGRLALGLGSRATKDGKWGSERQAAPVPTFAPWPTNPLLHMCLSPPPSPPGRAAAPPKPQPVPPRPPPSPPLPSGRPLAPHLPRHPPLPPSRCPRPQVHLGPIPSYAPWPLLSSPLPPGRRPRPQVQRQRRLHQLRPLPSQPPGCPATLSFLPFRNAQQRLQAPSPTPQATGVAAAPIPSLTAPVPTYASWPTNHAQYPRSHLCRLAAAPGRRCSGSAVSTSSAGSSVSRNGTPRA